MKTLLRLGAIAVLFSTVAGALTAAELAVRSGTHERYVREWLNAHAASGYVNYLADSGRYQLSPEQAMLFAQEESPAFIVGGFQTALAAGRIVDRLTDAFRSGDGIGWHEHHHDLFAGSVGQTGTPAGNALAAAADLVVSVGCRFTDWSASSWRRGVSFSIPPAKLVHIDVDVYASAKDVFNWVVPRLSQLGIIVFDDYGFLGCEGITRLVHELAEDQRFFTYFNLNGHAVMLKLKA